MSVEKTISNVIRKDGQVHYYGVIINQNQSDTYFNELLHNIKWTNEKLTMFGREITINRKVAFYADSFIEYTYSKKTKRGLAWTPLLQELKKFVSAHTDCDYNACLLNLYHNGDEGMGWHSDDEKEIVPNSSIASLSFGAERKFALKHKADNEYHSIVLEHGSLLEMSGILQKKWLHALTKSKKVKSPRINLTFRKMVVR